jgi:imidazolonepropionase-like amidohydrolase
MRTLLLAVCLLTVSCQSSGVKVLIGATLVPATGSTPIPDAVIVVAGDTIRAAGIRKDVPVPQDSERTDLTGKWVLPMGHGRIAPGEPADLLVLDGPAAGGPVIRHLMHGQWK